MFRITEDPSSAIKITRMVLSCPLTWTRSVLWQHILTRCACVWFTVYEGIFYNFNCIYMSYIVHQLDNKVFKFITMFTTAPTFPSPESHDPLQTHYRHLDVRSGCHRRGSLYQKWCGSSSWNGCEMYSTFVSRKWGVFALATVAVSCCMNTESIGIQTQQ